VQQTVRRSPLTSTLLVASAAALLSGCAITNDMMATIALPTSETAQSGADAQAGAPPVLTPSPPSGAQSNSMIVTGRQRAYLDALAGGGVQPSNDLLALSIGSYVCQARAAKQGESAVWDFVLPLVRSDVRKPGSTTAPAAEVDARTADYIRIATEHLC